MTAAVIASGMHAVPTLCHALGAPPAGACGNPMVHMPLLDLLSPGAEDVIAVQSGAWTDPDTWGGTPPMPGERVLIPVGVTVVVDVHDDGDGKGPDTTRFHTVRVDGVLEWATDRDTAIYLDTLFSSPTGVIRIGTDSQPIDAARTAEIIIIADDAMDLDLDRGQLGRGFIPHGTTRVVGADKTDFSAIAGDASAGATTLTLRDAPVGWRAGDQLVLAGTYFDPDGSDADNSRFHDEVLTLVSVDGATITFTNNAEGFEGLRWDHVRPSGAHFSAGDLEIHLANLTRNVAFRSELDPASPDAPTPDDLQDRRRGHMMSMHTPDVIMRNAAFVDFGRLNKDEFIDDPGVNVDGTPGLGLNPRGRYSVHLHRNLPRGNQAIDPDTCPPAEVTGCVVWGCPGWGFVHHDSYAIFEDNVAFDVLGAAFVQEAGNEIGLWRDNLSIKTTGDDDPGLTVEPFGDGYKRVTNFDFGFNGEAYWIQGAGQVEMIGNIAAGAAGGGADLFSDVDGNSNRDAAVVPRGHLPEARRHIVTNENGTIAVNRVPSNTFRDFTVYNSDFGMLSWNHMRNQGEWIGYTCPCDGNVHREYAHVDGFRFWNIYGQGVHLQYSSQMRFTNGLVASSDLATPGIDDKPALDLAINGDGRGFGFGMNGPTKRLVLDNVIVEGWRFGVRTPLEGQINALDVGEGTGAEGADGLPFRRSEFRGLMLANNDANFYRRQNGFTDPQTFSNFLVIEGGHFQIPESNQPPIADFTHESLGGLGVVRLSGLASRDHDTPGEFLPPRDPRAVAVNDDNYIVAYAWDLDGDGEPDAFGERVTAQLTPFTEHAVTLTVWDHQGEVDSVTLTVVPSPMPYENVIVDSSFEAGEYVAGLYALSSQFANRGWGAARASLVDGRTILAGQYGFSSVAQTIFDDAARRGEQRLSFRIESREAQAEPAPNQINRVFVRVFGIRGEHGSMHREATPVQEGAIPVQIETLFQETFTGEFGETLVERAIDFGADGYDYIYVGFQGEGLWNQTPEDFVALDDVELRGDAVACSPADWNADGVLNAADVGAFLTQYFQDLAGGGLDADFDRNGIVNAADVGAFLTRYFGDLSSPACSDG